MMIINQFTGQYRFLSNFSLCTVSLDGIDYPTVEHAYQAAKTDDIDARRYIAGLNTPGKAKRAGRKVSMKENWDQIKISVMEKLLRQKFCNPELRALLLETGELELIEGNTWGDRFWGKCEGVGRNELGKALMRVREALR